MSLLGFQGSIRNRLSVGYWESDRAVVLRWTWNVLVFYHSSPTTPLLLFQTR